MRILISGVSFLAQSAAVFAAVTGTIADQAGKPAAEAFIRIVDASDSTRESQALANAQGRYRLDLPESGSGLLARPRPGRSATTQALPDGSGSFFDIRGRTLAREYPARYPERHFPQQEGSIAEAAKVAAGRDFRVTIHGKGIYPYQGVAAAWADGDARDFKLTATDLWDSTRVILRDNLGNCGYRFRNQKQGRVAFLGGSITFNPGWRDSVQAFLRAKFPGTAFAFINAGIPSVGSDMHGFRLRRDVLEKGRVDLLFLESAVNDTTNGVPSQVRTRAYEGIVRQALADNPFMDIVYLYFLDPSFYPNIKAGLPNSLITDYEKSAVQYGISTLNLAQYVAERYTWEAFGGNVHPGPLGQGIYYRCVSRLLAKAWEGSPALTAPVAHHVPVKPLDPLCFQQGHTDSISRAVIVNGWRRVESWVPTQGGTRDGFFNIPMLEATAPGDTLKLSFTGTAIGIVIPAGPDVGMLEYAIDGKVLGVRDLFTAWSAGLNIPWTQIFSSELAMGQHELRLVTAPGKNAGSTGHACRIIRFVVNGPG